MTARSIARGIAILTAFLVVVPSAAFADESAEPPPPTPVDQVIVPGDGEVETEPVGTLDAEGNLVEELVEFDPLDEEQAFREIVFPVVGVTSFSATYGACRDGCSRAHMGADIATYGWKGVSVVAAHDGTIISARVGGALSGCSVALEADDGWTTRYIHLNDDVPGTDLKDENCFAPGVEVGARVKAGTLLGWVGDSGNAEGTTPHLHFEIRNPDGLAVEPWFSLVDAHHVDFSWIGTEDLVQISQSAFKPDVSTAFVVATEQLDDIALARSDITEMNAPLIAFDTADPTSAFAALRQLEPDRIVVLANGERPAFTDTLTSYAPLVAVGLLPEPPETEPVDDPQASPGAEEEPIEPDFRHDAVEDRVITLIAGRNLAPGIQSVITELGFTHRIVTIETQMNPSGDHGSDALTQPDQHADRNVLWWNTAEGWVFSESADVPPDTGLAFVSAADLTPWTLAYLTSLAVAPPMPLWHNEPTPRPSRSL